MHLTTFLIKKKLVIPHLESLKKTANNKWLFLNNYTENSLVEYRGISVSTDEAGF